MGGTAFASDLEFLRHTGPTHQRYWGGGGSASKHSAQEKALRNFSNRGGGSKSRRSTSSSNSSGSSRSLGSSNGRSSRGGFAGFICCACTCTDEDRDAALRNARTIDHTGPFGFPSVAGDLTVQVIQEHPDESLTLTQDSASLAPPKWALRTDARNEASAENTSTPDASQSVNLTALLGDTGEHIYRPTTAIPHTPTKACAGAAAFPRVPPAAVAAQEAPGAVTKLIERKRAGIVDVSGGVSENGFEKVKRLGKGGMGEVWLCDTRNPGPESQQPELFALKEMLVEEVFRPGVDDLRQHIEEHIPLNEAAIQMAMAHVNIVETYWADVRVVDKELKPLDIQMDHLKEKGSWVPLKPDRIKEMDDACKQAYTRPVGPQRAMPNSVKLQLRIAMEYCTLGSLRDYLRTPLEVAQHGNMSLMAAKALQLRGRVVSHDFCALMTALDIAQALKLMHKQRILHSDLKPLNVLITEDPTDARGYVAKLADFGIASHMHRGQDGVDITTGTVEYLSRDGLETLKATVKTDVYALGLILWELWHGVCWASIYAFEKKARGVESYTDMWDFKPKCSSSCPEMFANVVHRCLERDPEARPTIRQVSRELRKLVPHVAPDILAEQADLSSYLTADESSLPSENELRRWNSVVSVA